MKKFLSAALAFVMVCALMVPAFAAELNVDTPSGTTLVKTSTLDEEGNPARGYTVNFPADTEIAWGTASTDVSYSVESHLLRNEAVQVTVAGSAESTMKTDPANGEVYELAYKLDGKTAYKASSPVVYPAEKQVLSVLVSDEAWNKAVVETYSDILTYTAEVVAL